MSDAMHIWWSCGRKKRYQRKKQAMRDAKKFNQTSYHCATCNGWHNTSNNS